MNADKDHLNENNSGICLPSTVFLTLSLIHKVQPIIQRTAAVMGLYNLSYYHFKI
tara:strand:- start:10767 stop:10931 length:165 start_codon:yes stop_codon:yes gene_type:complete